MIYDRYIQLSYMDTEKIKQQQQEKYFDNKDYKDQGMGSIIDEVKKNKGIILYNRKS